MRNVDRLDVFYDELKEIHKKYWPDWRFGQLCSNFFGWLTGEKGVSMFYPEESNMLKYFKEFAEDKSLFRRPFDLDP